MHSGHVVGRVQLARQDGMALRTTKDLSIESSSVEETEPTLRQIKAQKLLTLPLRWQKHLEQASGMHCI